MLHNNSNSNNGQITRLKRNELKIVEVKEKLEIIYYVQQKDIAVVHEVTQQRLIGVTPKRERYDNRTSQFKQNRLLELNQKW